MAQGGELEVDARWHARVDAVAEDLRRLLGRAPTPLADALAAAVAGLTTI